MSKTLIISEHSFQPTVEHVMDWLIYMGREVERINGDDLEDETFSFAMENSSGNLRFFLGDREFKMEYASIWFRRWSGNEEVEKLSKMLRKKFFSLGLATAVLGDKYSDNKTVFRAFLDNLSAKKLLTNADQISVNKLNVLIQAEKCGLNVPKFLVTNSKDKLLEFYKRHGKIITKDLDGPFVFAEGKKMYSNYATMIEEKDFEKISEVFGRSLFQNYIEKNFEIRSFFLLGKIYSMAIFSQKSEHTKIDFRNYDKENPNRTVPFNLPGSIEKKILNLMQELSLETGSIDLIKGRDGAYYFLEVNPVGQFGMVSIPCNYRLEEKVAEYLYA